MTYFGGGGRAPTAPRPPGRPDVKSILPIGGRVLVVRGGSSDACVSLSDEPGHVLVGTVGVGAEVEVRAWRPRGGWGTRYRIRTPDGSEGWVDAVNLQARPEPVAPVRAPAPATPPVTRMPRPKRGRKPKSA